ncbi:GNAT family N-acetyltransferase [Bacillus hwajinpoensis]|uniref:GNAT family N-acetyltransferase n=1 Tax=Guptibacillus hwajinpoensis TaxID=208199 RepID=A0A845EZE6_9BACL|nr:GNAT family N-acetyltransferase [Pseudalkalibacillus hwajinpoensis]MYL63865.1 GNAT family N-acetyltransferase [Pseudalkalibacillus hwajinpoensis]
MEVSLHRLQESDSESLFHFEIANRVYFNKMVPDRGEDYYKFETFNAKLVQLINEQSLGLSTFYLIKDEIGTIIGRINLVDFNHSNESVELGYRISEDQSGKGIATLGVKQVLDDVYHQDKIKHISARTTKDNLASQKVLENNGFTYLSTDPDEVLLNGVKVNLIHYRWSK